VGGFAPHSPALVFFQPHFGHLIFLFDSSPVPFFSFQWEFLFVAHYVRMWFTSCYWDCDGSVASPERMCSWDTQLEDVTLQNSVYGHGTALFILVTTHESCFSFQWEFIFRSVPHAFFWGIVCVSTRHLLSSCFPSSSLVLGLFVSWACLCHCMHMHVGMIVLGAHVFQWELIFVNITCVCGSLVA